ncbi:MAG TPA: MFS transporter [Streptosporangiaceae bacterium]
MRTAWRLVAGHRDLRLVLSAALVSQAGDWILLTGLLYHVYALTGSTAASGLTMLSSFLPQMLLGPVAGVFADRWNRKLTMIAADVLLAAGLLPLLAVGGRGQIWIVFAVLIWEGAIQQFFSPAQRAMIPRLVPDEQLVTANALSGQVGDLSRLAGSALGGIIVATGGITGVALADAASFLASAGLLTLTRTSGAVSPGQGPPKRSGRLAAIGRDLGDGLRLAAHDGLLRALMIFALVTGVGEGIVATLVAPFVRHVLGGGSQAFGLLLAAQAIGGIAGGVLAVSLGQRVRPALLFSYGAVALGLVDLATFLYPLGYVAVWPALAGGALAGLPVALMVAGMMTLFQQGTADSFRGRVFGAYGATQGFAVLAGTLAGGLLARPLGIIAVISVQGAAYLAAGVVMAVWLRDHHAASRPAGQQFRPAPDQAGDRG